MQHNENFESIRLADNRTVSIPRSPIQFAGRPMPLRAHVRRKRRSAGLHRVAVGGLIVEGTTDMHMVDVGICSIQTHDTVK